jgi:hypothetical protein
MPRLPHNHALGHAVTSCGCYKSRAQTVAGKIRVIHAGEANIFFDNERNVLRSERLGINPLCPDLAEDRSFADAGRAQPHLQRAYGVGLFMFAVRDGNLPTLPELISLGAPESNQ